MLFVQPFSFFLQAMPQRASHMPTELQQNRLQTGLQQTTPQRETQRETREETLKVALHGDPLLHRRMVIQRGAPWADDSHELI